MELDQQSPPLPCQVRALLAMHILDMEDPVMEILFSLNELHEMESLQRVHRRNLHAIIRNEGTTYGMNIYLYSTGRISNGNSSKL